MTFNLQQINLVYYQEVVKSLQITSVAKFGASQDMTIFHDGTDSLIANKTGTLKIATETSGIPVR